MQLFYLDESGSQTKNNLAKHPVFVIAMVRVIDKNAFQKSCSRFVRKSKADLMKSDKMKGGEMFDGDELLELKGSCFTSELKQKFVSYFASKPSFEVYYIVLDNRHVGSSFCNVPARSFNYLLKLAFQHYRNSGAWPDDEYHLISDIQNLNPHARFWLAEYLNIELGLSGTVSGNIRAEYRDSRNLRGIQIADVFANLYYSHLLSGRYAAEMKVLRDAGIAKHEFIYPLGVSPIKPIF